MALNYIYEAIHLLPVNHFLCTDLKIKCPAKTVINLECFGEET